MPATVYALSANNILLKFDSASPNTLAATTTVAVPAGETLQGIDFRPRTGQLIGITFPTASTGDNPAKTYSINPNTGAVTLIGTSATVTGGNDSTANDIDFNPTVDRIRFASAALGNARINPNNGVLVTNDVGITPNTTEIIGLAYDRNTDRASTAYPTTLYVIDRATGTLGRLGSVDGAPNSPTGGVYTQIGALGVTLSATLEGGFDIVEATGAAGTANNNGLGTAYAALASTDGQTRFYSINLTTGAATLIGLVGTNGAEVYDLAVVPEGTVVVGSGLGANGDVRLLDPATGALRTAAPIIPFDGFKGGVRVATGDVNGDGVPDAIVTAIEAGNGHIKVFNGITGQQLTGAIGSFFSFAGFAGSVNVGAGDVNGDGFADVLVVANGANGHVKIFSGLDGTLLNSFLSYQSFLGNVTISAADFDNDGLEEVVTAAAINGHTKVFNGETGTAFVSASLPSFQNSFLAFSPYLGNVSVAVGDVNGDGTPDLVLGSGPGVRFNIRVVNGRDGTLISSFFVNDFGTTFTGGGYVALSDFNRDGRYDILTTPGVGIQASAVAIDPLTGTKLGSFTAFSNFLGGATVAASRF
ncbi:DUF4394 domain-containing protein [Gemmata obscuriglobus]|uniref:DUF4394 domain-containing protein n=1 Tax=Gemmata obscuriglobus TaxID=114 RepID=UPI00137C3B14|nr:DUF4394 domain-containing protein [Gemmata obscuriglobus]VTS00427.1 Hemolysin-type calcium-binding region domain protein OS=Rhodopirellula maiorica SM1 GN=RMSM_03614 PE=4 SV=1: DUF4394: VCBS: VCBS [Gemmata obscuriglobus UQM 2246]